MTHEKEKIEWNKFLHQGMILLAILTLLLVNVIDNQRIGAWICISMGVFEIATGLFGRKITGFHSTSGAFFNGLAGVWLIIVGILLFPGGS